MLTLLFIILMIWVMWKVFGLLMKMTCGVLGAVLMVILLPIIFIGLLLGGLLYVAFPLLLIIGGIALFMGIAEG